MLYQGLDYMYYYGFWMQMEKTLQRVLNYCLDFEFLQFFLFLSAIKLTHIVYP